MTVLLEGNFYDLKEKAILIWTTYDDTFGYATEKINRIKKIKSNDKWGFEDIISLFDIDNQTWLVRILEDKTLKDLYETRYIKDNSYTKDYLQLIIIKEIKKRKIYEDSHLL